MSKAIIFQRDLSEQALIKHLSGCNIQNAQEIQENKTLGYLSVDCEMMGLKPARDRLCLVQICDESNNTSLIQIQPDQDSAPNLKILLEHENITKIFHYARADLAFLKYYLDISVNPVFCTKIASKLARTYTESHSLKAVTKELLNIEINKYQQSSDWGKDSLSNDQIEYASEDVTHLNNIRISLSKILEREGRMELAQECFKQIFLMSRLDILEYEYIFEHTNPKNNRS